MWVDVGVVDVAITTIALKRCCSLMQMLLSPNINDFTLPAPTLRLLKFNFKRETQKWMSIFFISSLYVHQLMV